MEEVIKKWELILKQDSDRDITYGRKVLEEMLIDVKMAVKNCNAPDVIGSAKRCKAPLKEYQFCMDDYTKKKCFDCEHYL